MIKELKYSGYSATPSDYDCPDGNLGTSINVISEDGALYPILPPATVVKLSEGQSVKYIHETSKFKHYVCLDSNNKTVFWFENNKEELEFINLKSFSETTEIHQITSIGNTLIILATDGSHFFLWGGSNQEYLYLGTKLPELPISFGLQGEVIGYPSLKFGFDFDLNAYPEDVLFKYELDSVDQERITGLVLGEVNKFIAENSIKKGRFLYPFFVRYAYRLYDGSLTMHSAPILMIASSDITPCVMIDSLKKESSAQAVKGGTAKIVGVFHQLDYAVKNIIDIENLKKWEDIIRSVDIFISKPVYTYDQNGKCERFVRPLNSGILGSYSVCKHVNQSLPVETFPLRYQLNTFHDIFSKTIYPTPFQISGFIELPKRNLDKVKEDIKKCSQFYFLESVKIDELKTERTVINVKEDYLQSLVTREVMTDDYNSHDTIIPEYAFTYNSRLNITNIKKKLFDGYNTYSLLPFSDGFIKKDNSSTESTIYDYTYNVTIYYYIKQDGRDIILRGDSDGVVAHNTPILFIYYPNINAYKAVVVIKAGSYTEYYEILLEQHNFLNGSFYFGGWEDLNTITELTPKVSSIVERIIEIPNKIYTSEINNPFHYPATGINTVGTGNIIAISSAAKALSEGQFGQFPLYAFTTEGVWALEVSNTGGYIAKQPITRDVVIGDGKSITQIDNAVLFATDRGIMLLSGSNAICISDIINAFDQFSITELPKPDKLLSVFNNKVDENKVKKDKLNEDEANNNEDEDKDAIEIDNITLIPFTDFISSCRMIYDYTHQRIIIFNPNIRYAYVYSMKSKMWGMILSDIKEVVNSYPEALAMTKYNELVNFSLAGKDSTTALIVTRPIKIDNSDEFKTIDSIIQRGMFHKNNVVQVLYGSNDFYNWNMVWSSNDKYMRGFRGTPYKAFRIALICSFDKSESLSGCTIQHTIRMTNKPR